MTPPVGDSSTALSRLFARLRFVRSPHVAAVAVLVLLIVAFFWQSTLQGQVISSADLMYGHYPWKAYAPEGFTPENPYQTDDAEIFYPRRYAFYNDTGDAWWQNDYIASDRNSFFVDSLGLQFYPPAYVYEALPFDIANTVYTLTILLVAGLSMYLLLWQLKYPWLARMLGAILYTFNGHFIVWLGHTYLPASLGVIPLMLFGFERFREARQPAWLLIPAACIAIEVYLGYAPAWIVTGVILIAYGAVRLAPTLYARRLREAAAEIAAYAAAGAVGLLLAAYSLLPSFTSAANSSYQTGRTVGLGHFPLEAAWTNLFPAYWGSDTFWFGPIGNPPEVLGYVGISVVPLAIAGLWHLRRQWLGWFCLLLVVFTVTQVYGIPPLKELANLPGIKQIVVGRWLYLTNFAVALMASAGLAALLDQDLSTGERRRLAAIVGGVLLVALVAVFILWLDRSDGQSWERITEGYGLVAEPLTFIERLGTPFHRQMLFIVLGAGFVAVAFLRPVLARPAAAALCVLAFIDLFAFGQDYNATIARDDVYPDTPLIEFLQEQEGFFRIAPIASDGHENVMPGNTPNVFSLNTVIGYDHYRNEAYLDYLDPMMTDSDRVRAVAFGYERVALDRGSVNRNLLSLLAVKYVVTPPAGLWSALDRHVVNDAPYAAYDGLTQGVTLIVSPEADAVEIMLGTAGRLEAGTEVVIHVREGPGQSDLAIVRLETGAVVDSWWQPIPLPAGVGGQVYVEVEAPGATAERPLIVWGSVESPSTSTVRFESGAPVDGALTYRVLEAPGDWARPVYDGLDGVVYEVTTALPLAWGAGGTEVFPTREEALERIVGDDFDPAETVVFAREDAPAGVAASAPGGVFEVEVTNSANDRLTVQTNFAADGWLVLSQRYDDGWRAEVDGTGAEVLRGDNNLQVVRVPAGEHEVTLEFRPWEYVWGQRVSLATVFLLIAGSAVALVWRRRSAKASG
ncbi:MAG: YfhO family protein [Chloroflexi bacterium]|nr:YfhO family protein [Chloroflexota bacterium]MCI0884587.1 YfhO family protein [Chloroflexota bacterium]